MHAWSVQTPYKHMHEHRLIYTRHIWGAYNKTHVSSSFSRTRLWPSPHLFRSLRGHSQHDCPARLQVRWRLVPVFRQPSMKDDDRQNKSISMTVPFFNFRNTKSKDPFQSRLSTMIDKVLTSIVIQDVQSHLPFSVGCGCLLSDCRNSTWWCTESYLNGTATSRSFDLWLQTDYCWHFLLVLIVFM